MIKFDPIQHTIDIGVHDLIDAGPPAGDLHIPMAWRSKTRMKEGQKIHTLYQKLRAEQDVHFQAEVTVRYVLVYKDWEITISGRLDGYTQEKDMLVVEEIKSSTLPKEQLEDLKLHDVAGWRRQLELYLHFLYSQGKDVIGRLIVISVLDASEKIFTVTPNLQMEEYIVSQISWIVEQYEEREEWLKRRALTLTTGLPFPHESYREGQRELVDSIIPELSQGKHVFLSAPTGSGKTAAALYSALHHAYENNLRVFFATARTTQQLMAEQTVAFMTQKGMPIRAVSIRAKEKICLNDEVRCDAEHCPYSAGYFDKLRRNDTLKKAWEVNGSKGDIWPSKIIRIAEEQYICPHALSIDLANMADLVIGDFNYLFDPSVRLSMVSLEPSNWIVIVDEAHNLPERAMGYGSPRISLCKVWTVLEKVRGSIFARPIQKLYTYMLEVLTQHTDKEWTISLSEFDTRLCKGLVEEFENLAVRYAKQKQESPFFDEEEGDLWVDVARTIFRFATVLGHAQDETLVICTKGYKDRRIKKDNGLQLFSSWAPRDEATSIALLNRDPSLMLAPIFKGFQSSIIMSATLEPMEYYVNMFGIDTKHASLLRYPSFFPKGNKACFVVPTISTKYRDRDRDRKRTAQILSDIIASTRGNIAIFFPSFVFMEQIIPDIAITDQELILQTRKMSEQDRYSIIEQMKKENGSILCAVMGGIFSEGIDLPNKALCCAVMVGPCLPQASLARRKIQEWNEAKYQKGFAYAWLVPGLARVAQAAGRVIRTPSDKGTIILLGKRFAQRSTQKYLPAELKPQITHNISADIQDFWSMHHEH